MLFCKLVGASVLLSVEAEDDGEGEEEADVVAVVVGVDDASDLVRNSISA